MAEPHRSFDPPASPSAYGEASPSVPWHRPCPQCNFDLYGRPIGGCCPECGRTIEGSMPEWWKLDLLARVEAGARFAKQATRALLLVPVLMVCILSTALGSMPHNQAPAAVIGVLIVLALAAVQVVAHFIAVDRVSRLPLDPKRASRLRLANTIRIVTVAVLAGSWMMEVAELWMSTLWQVTLYFGAPIAFAVADTMALRTFRSLPRELGWRDSGWTQFASASSVVLIPLMGVFMLVPFLGWLIAPVIWIIALAEGFRALERFACIAPTRL